MKCKIDESDYPLLWVQHSDNSMGVFRSSDELTTCGRGSESFFENLILISPKGKKYVVLRATVIGKAGAIAGLNFLKYLGLYQVKVRLDYNDKCETIDLPELKKNILYIFDKDDEYWDSDGRLFVLKEKIKHSGSINTIVLLMEQRYFNRSFD